jgi:ATP-dependent RNA helicase RhlE
LDRKTDANFDANVSTPHLALKSLARRCDLKPMSLEEPSRPFEELGLGPELLDAVRREGYSAATAVQAAAIPAIIAGHDVKVRAETGSGKTLAYGLPLLQQLIDRPRELLARSNPVAVLVLVPTRELAVQVAEVLAAMASSLRTRLKVLAAFGGVSINPQMLALRGGVDVLVATPGRLLDLQQQNALNLATLRALVLDEADRMLNLGFSEELTQILKLLPDKRQNLLLSATFPPSLAPIIRDLLCEPHEIDVTVTATPRLIEQRVYTVSAKRKAALLVSIIKSRNLGQVLVFVSEKRSADVLVKRLNGENLNAAVFHSDKSQTERQRCLSEFRAGRLRVLIATDLAARGIDVEDLPTVINFELPRSPNDYTHRIGRTGRAGKPGLAISLICPDEYAHFRVIEKRIKQRLTREQMPGFEMEDAN